MLVKEGFFAVCVCVSWVHILIFYLRYISLSLKENTNRNILMCRKCYFYIIRKLSDYANNKVLKLFKNKNF